MIIATHDVEEAAVLAARVVVLRLRPGRVGADLLPTDERPRRPETMATEAAMRAIQEALENAFA